MNTDKPQYNTARDFLKILAIIAITVDHVSTYLMEYGTVAYEVCQFFGNFTIGVMSYFIVQGVKYTHSIKRYAIRMLIWAVIYQFPYYLLRHDYDGHSARESYSCLSS